jgi:hypothetical protein
METVLDIQALPQKQFTAKHLFANQGDMSFCISYATGFLLVDRFAVLYIHETWPGFARFISRETNSMLNNSKIIRGARINRNINICFINQICFIV